MPITASEYDLSTRLVENPIITAADVRPSRPGVEVVSVFNAGAVQVKDEVVLLLRVSEQAIVEDLMGPDALSVDFSVPGHPTLPLGPGYQAKDLLPFSFLNTHENPPHLVDVLLPKDTPWLDTAGDPRGLHYAGTPNGIEVTNDFLTQMSHLRVARSRDGIHFVVEDVPAIAATSELEEYGCEDARITYIDGLWYITYVSVARIGITTSLASTSDFKSFTRHGVIFLPENKDIVLFPEKVGGHYAALTRPMPPFFGRVMGMWVAFSDDLESWGHHAPLLLPRYNMWDESRTGASTVPFRADGGWLVIYHGVDRTNRYALGAALLGEHDLTKVVARSAEPIMVPQAPYERVGLYSSVIFPCGHVSLDASGERIRVYYGAGDSVLAAADFSVPEILASLTPVN